MSFDIRTLDYTFKHSISSMEDLNDLRFREHYHTKYELLYFVTGDADFRIKHTLYNLRPGSLLIAKPGEYHNIVFRSKQPYERYVFRFPPQELPSDIRKQMESLKSVYYIEDSPIAKQFRQMDGYINEIHPNLHFYICTGALNIIISYLINSRGLSQQADRVNKESRRIVEYIDSHLPEINTAEDVASALHMSKSFMYKIFANQFETSPMSYIRTQKCVVAKDMLSSGIPAIEVCSRLGFKTYSSFYRNYMKVFREPPRAAVPSLRYSGREQQKTKAMQNETKMNPAKTEETEA